MFQTKLEIFRYPIQRKNRLRSKTFFKMASTLKCLIPSASPRPLSSGENPLSAGLWDYMRQKRERTGTIFKNLYISTDTQFITLHIRRLRAQYKRQSKRTCPTEPEALTVHQLNTITIRPIPIVLVKCWKVAHWNAKKLLKNCQKSKKLLPKFQKLLPKFLAIFI